MDRRYALKSFAAVGVSAVVAGCTTKGPGEGDLYDVISSHPNLFSLSTAIAKAGLINELKVDGPLTVFAPSNRAFLNLPEATVEQLKKPENVNMMIALLANHVVSGSFPTDNLAGTSGPLTTMQGRSINIDGIDGVKVEDANVITPDLTATNGVIHIIDKVLSPM